jgi:DNA polymerase-3 subunit gamma/tau
MSLYQKYRPNNFNEMYGDKDQFSILESLMKKQGKPHAFLFHGESGCGKTTAARICASLLGANKDLSLFEFNTANNRGIDTARDIIERIQYKTIDNSNNVYIIDECHQLTKDFQNAILKVLEDTPEHVYFFLCTTDKKKLDKAILTRCMQFQFKSLHDKEIYKILFKICKKEKLEIEKDILQEISENCCGSPRVAIVLLEKIKEVNKKEEMLSIINNVINEDDKESIDLCRALLKNESWNTIKEILKDLKNKDAESVRWIVMSYMSSCLLSSENKQAGKILEFFSEPFYNSKFNGLVLACHQSKFF